MDTVNWNGEQIPVVGTVIADNKTYVIETGGNVIAWTDGEPWHGFPTTALIVTKFKTVDEARAAFDAVAKNEW